MYRASKKNIKVHLGVSILLAVIGLLGSPSAVRGALTPLHAAVSRGDEEGLEHALASLKTAPYDIDQKWCGNITALMMAVDDGNVELADRLLCAGATLENAGLSLRAAIEKGRVSLVRWLLGKSNPEGYELADFLRHAAKKGHVGIAKALLDAGARKNVDCTASALCIAVCKGHTPFVRCLLEYTPSGAPKTDTRQLVNGSKYGKTPLMMLADSECDRPAMARLLLRYGAKKEASGSNGWTALHFASQRGHVGMVRVLLDAGAKRMACAKDGGQTPLHLAAIAEHRAVMNCLLRYSTQDEINARDARGRTPLYVATAADRLEAMRALLRYDTTEVDVSDNDGSVPLHVAVVNASIKALNLLLQAGAQVEGVRYVMRYPVDSREKAGAIEARLSAAGAQVRLEQREA